MADRQLHPDTPELRARWSGFAWSKDSAKQAKVIVDLAVLVATKDAERAATYGL